jgi:hypothetical protein
MHTTSGKEREMSTVRRMRARQEYDVTQSRVVPVEADAGAVCEAAAAVGGSSQEALDTVVAAVVGGHGEVVVDWDVRSRPSEQGSFVSLSLGFRARDERSREALLDAWRTVGPAAAQAAAQALRAIKAYAEEERWAPRRGSVAVAA